MLVGGATLNPLTHSINHSHSVQHLSNQGGEGRQGRGGGPGCTGGGRREGHTARHGRGERKRSAGCAPHRGGDAHLSRREGRTAVEGWRTVRHWREEGCRVHGKGGESRTELEGRRKTALKGRGEGGGGAVHLRESGKDLATHIAGGVQVARDSTGGGGRRGDGFVFGGVAEKATQKATQALGVWRCLFAVVRRGGRTWRSKGKLRRSKCWWHVTCRAPPRTTLQRLLPLVLSVL